MENKPNKIILHHSATADGPTVSWGAIRRFHVVECAWGAIGYHYGIELVGDYYEVLIGGCRMSRGRIRAGRTRRRSVYVLSGTLTRRRFRMRNGKGGYGCAAA
jgi:hypothetical protein